MFRFKSSFKAKRFKEIIKYLADFLKTNPTKFTVICIKKRQKARFLSPRSSKIKVTKEKERRKGRARRRKGREEKKGMVALLAFTRVTLEMAHFDRLAEFFGNNWYCEMSSIDAKWPETPSFTSKWHTDWQIFFENI